MGVEDDRGNGGGVGGHVADGIGSGDGDGKALENGLPDSPQRSESEPPLDMERIPRRNKEVFKKTMHI